MKYSIIWLMFDATTLIASTNFVAHFENKVIEAKLERIAEGFRKILLKRMGLNEERNWDKKCHIFLFDDANEFARSSGIPKNIPGFTRFRRDGQSEIFLNGFIKLKDVLPHEITHAIIFKEYGIIPRWADEGIAVLNETKESVNRLKKHLALSDVCFGAKNVLLLSDYPSMENRRLYYAESVLLTEYFIDKGGYKKFCLFLKNIGERADRRTVEAALMRYYGNTLKEIEREANDYIERGK